MREYVHLALADAIICPVLRDGELVRLNCKVPVEDMMDVIREVTAFPPELAALALSYHEDEKDIYTTNGAFAAKLRDGRVVTWGSSLYGGDSSSVQAELQTGVDTVYSTRFAFAAKLRDCLLYTSPSPRDATLSRMPSSA